MVEYREKKFWQDSNIAEIHVRGSSFLTSGTRTDGKLWDTKYFPKKYVVLKSFVAKNMAQKNPKTNIFRLNSGGEKMFTKLNSSNRNFRGEKFSPIGKCAKNREDYCSHVFHTFAKCASVSNIAGIYYLLACS